MTDSGLFVQFLLISPLLLVSLVLHELAHGWVAYRLGDPTAKVHGRLTLNPLRHLDLWGTVMLVVTFLGSGGSFFLGWAKPVPVDPRYFKDGQRGMMWVGLAGPLTNYAMALVAAGLIWLTYLYTDSFFLLKMFWMLFLLNVILGTLNLLPIPPLDGSRVVGGFLPRATYARWAELDRYGNYRLHRALRRALHLPGGVRGHVRAPSWTSRCRSCPAGGSGDGRGRWSGENETASAGCEWARRRRHGRLPGAGRRSLGAALRQPQSRAVRRRRVGPGPREPAALVRRRRYRAGAPRRPRPGPRHRAGLGGRGRGGSRGPGERRR